MDAIKIKTKGLTGYVKKEYWTPEFDEMLGEIDRYFTIGKEKSDSLREVTVTSINLDVNNTNRCLSVKYIKPMYLSIRPNLDKFIRNIFKASKAEQSWRIAHTLLEHKIPVPAPIAFLDQRRLGVLTKCYYIAAHLVDAHNLHNFLVDLNNTISKGNEDKNILILRKKGVIKEMGRLIGSLHSNGFRHGDLGIGNMMISCKTPDIFHLYLVDIETITHHNHLPEKEMAYDIACMYSSVLKILTWIETRLLMRAYFDANPSLKPKMRWFLREIRTELVPILQKSKFDEERKGSHIENLQKGKRVLFIDSVREEGMLEIIEKLKRNFPMSEFALFVIREDTLFSKMRNLFSYMREIKQGAYGIVIDWHGSLLTALLTSLSGAELRMGYRSRNFIKNRIFYNFMVRVHSWSIDRKIRLLAPLKALGIAVSDL